MTNKIKQKKKYQKTMKYIENRSYLFNKPIDKLFLLDLSRNFRSISLMVEYNLEIPNIFFLLVEICFI